MTPQTLVALTSPVTAHLPPSLRDRLHGLLNLAIYHFTDVVHYRTALNIRPFFHRGRKRLLIQHQDGSISMSPYVRYIDNNARIVFFKNGRVLRYTQGLMPESVFVFHMLNSNFERTDPVFGEDTH